MKFIHPEPDATLQFSAFGVALYSWVDDDGDVSKVEREAVFADGSTLRLAWSPFSEFTLEDFKLWLSVGCPGYVTHDKGGRNLTREDLRGWAAEQAVHLHKRDHIQVRNVTGMSAHMREDGETLYLFIDRADGTGVRLELDCQLDALPPQFFKHLNGSLPAANCIGMIETPDGQLSEGTLTAA